MSMMAGRPSRAKTKKTLQDLADSPETVRVNFDLDKEEHTRLKIYAATHGKTIKEILKDLITSIK